MLRKLISVLFILVVMINLAGCGLDLVCGIARECEDNIDGFKNDFADYGRISLDGVWTFFDNSEGTGRRKGMRIPPGYHAQKRAVCVCFRSFINSREFCLPLLYD